MSLATLAVVGTASVPAHASLVLAKAGGDVHVAESRIALSSSPERTVVWEQLVLDDARGELAWVVAVPKGGWIEGGDPSWFDALDGATSPVIAPSASLSCPASTPPESTAEAISPNPVRSVDRAYLASTGAQAIDRLRLLGYVVDASTATLLQDVDAVGEEVVVLHLPAGGPGPTRVVRVISPPRPFPSTLVPLNAPIHAFVLAQERVKLEGAPQIEPAFDALTWLGGRSNYRDLVQRAASEVPNGVVVPFAGASLFADASIGARPPVGSLMRQYFGALESSDIEAWGCAHRTIGSAASRSLVAPTCPQRPPWSSDAVLPPCTPPSKEALPPGNFSCGAKDDLAVALGGASPSTAFLTRFEATSSIQTTTPHALEDAHLGAIPLYHEATTANAGVCAPIDVGPDPNPYGGYDAGTTSGPGSTTGDGSGTTPSSGSTSVYVHDDSCGNSSGSGGCNSSGGGSNDGCSKSDGSSGCGGSSSKSSDDGCGKSSSGDSCGKSSSSSDDGCGKSSGGSSGSGCGKSGSGADNGCSFSPRGVRVRVSPLGYLAAALAMIARRLSRRRRRDV